MISDGFSAEFVEIYDEFVVETPRLIENLAECVAGGDVAATARAAHQLKGSAANFGFVGVSDAAKEIEFAAKAGSIEGAGDRVAAARAAFQAGVSEVAARIG